MAASLRSKGGTMRVCVTGGTGFVGGALVRRLLSQGASVQVLARPSARAEKLRASGAEVIPGDLRDAASIGRAVHGADVVYHVAAKVESSGTREDFIETNARGTERVLAACETCGAGRVIYESSLGVYGLVQPGEQIDENSPYDEKPESREFYAQSKILADELAISFARKSGLSLVIFRPGLIYGPGKPLPLGLLGFRAGRTNFVFGNPHYRVPLNYVENLIDAMLLAAQSAGGGLRQYNIVDDEDLTLGQYHEARSAAEKTRTLFLPGGLVLFGAPLADSFLRAASFGRSSGIGLPKHQIERALEDRKYVTRRVREELGWAPKVQLGDAVRSSLQAAH
jgi:2-alkyl-3-oxoalkanoate reductase